MAFNPLRENRFSAKGCSSLVLLKKGRAFLLVMAGKAFLFCFVLFYFLHEKEG